jgi:hypothetical protein
MNPFVIGTCVVALSTFSAIVPAPAAPDQRPLVMLFDLWSEGPAQACGKECRTWVSATGTITADTPGDFEDFANAHQINGMTIALDSDGGSVHGALALGRAIRRLGMVTTVGKTVALKSDQGEKRARLLPHADCESMCAFVLLAGVERRVPAQARVLVHQIWLGDRREDPTAATYSAEDLVLVQRDIGRLVQYTVEMGGAMDLLEIALKIPPWEPMRHLSRNELTGMKIATVEGEMDANSGASVSPVAMASGSRASVSARSWSLLADADQPVLGRKHPLTVVGEEIGAFEIGFACSDSSRYHGVTYRERRWGDGSGRTQGVVNAVDISLLGKSIPLKVVSSRASGNSHEIQSVATGRVPAELLRTFADSDSRSLMIQTTSSELSTAIRIGNSGVMRSLAQFTAMCDGQTPSRNTARNDVRRGG